MSVGLDMNAKATRRVLNEAFKRFQQLPDWPVRPNLGRDSRRNEKDEPMLGIIVAPLALAGVPLPSRVLAE